MTKKKMLGIDLVYLPEFEEKFKNIALGKVFSLSEMAENKSKESLAGIFAAKEAFFKAIGKKADWLAVWIEKDQLGKPELQSTLIERNQKAEISISHAGDYTIAIVMIKDK